MSNQLESQIASYHRWREDIRGGIEAYQLWLDQHGPRGYPAQPAHL
jgi:hypothetical protein